MSIQTLLRRFKVASEGSMAVEFALLLPILLILLAAVVDFGAAVNRQMALSAAVRAGAQLAVAQPPTAETLHAVAAAIRQTAPEDPDEQQEVTVELFCERSDGEPVACDAGLPGQATYVTMRLSEVWAPTFSYPLHQRTMALAARQTVRVR
jgi:Flp pilus assembly protein TadG